MSADFWGPITEALNDSTAKCLDIGFRTTCSPPLDNSPDWLITHSLGTLFSFKENISPKIGYILINSFTRFIDFTPPHILNAMGNALDTDPHTTMKRFLTKAGLGQTLPDSQPIDWQIPRLHEGLEWLKTMDIGEALQQANKPVLCLLGGQDTICPLPKAEAQFNGYEIRICPEGGHGLPLTHAQWCAQEINHWIESL